MSDNDTRILLNIKRSAAELKTLQGIYDSMDKFVTRTVANGLPCPYCGEPLGHPNTCRYIRMRVIVDS